MATDITLQQGHTLSGPFTERRAGERRLRPTPMWCRHTLLGGRRVGARRSTDESAIFVDQHGQKVLLVAMSIIGLNVIDAWFTTLFLSCGGTELNPIVLWILGFGVLPFVVLKTVGIGLCVAFLILTKNFHAARIGMGIVLIGYLALACWHFYLLISLLDWVDV